MSNHEANVQAYYAQNFYAGMTDRASKGMDWALLEQAGGLEGKTVLDLGCSYPVDALQWATAAGRYILLDFCPAVIEQATKRLAEADITVETCLADMRDIPLPEASIDVVLSYSSLDHIPEGHERVHVAVQRVLKPGGRYVITVPNFETLGVRERAGMEHCGYYRTWTPEELRVELEAAGFVVHDFKSLPEVHRFGYWCEKPEMTTDGLGDVQADAGDQSDLAASNRDVSTESAPARDDSERRRDRPRTRHESR